MTAEITVPLAAPRDITRLQQTIAGGPKGDGGRPGDCYRTAIACLLGLDTPTQVPHFVEERMTLDDDAPWADLRRARHWLRSEHGVDLLTVPHEHAVALGVPYIAAVPSKRGPWPHCVLAREGVVLHDPSGVGGYTLDVLADEVVEVLVEPYEPDPDAMVEMWAATEGADL